MNGSLSPKQEPSSKMNGFKSYLLSFLGGTHFHDDAKLLAVALLLAYGAAIFFALPFDLRPTPLFVMLIVIFAAHRRLAESSTEFFGVGQFIRIIMLLSMGMFLGSFHTSIQSHKPVLTGFYVVKGSLKSLEGFSRNTELQKDKKIILCDLQIQERIMPAQNEKIKIGEKAKKDQNIRWKELKGCASITVRTAIADDLLPGESVTFRARLRAPPGPVYQGGFDYARYTFFKGLIGTGFAVSPVERTVLKWPEEASKIAAPSWRHRLDRYRLSVSHQMSESLQGDILGLAVALSVGQRGELGEKSLDNLRASGLAHLLAISGLHMGLITGFAFFLAERLLARWPGDKSPLIPAKFAAIIAFSVACGYLLLSGMALSTVRAFIMVSIGLLAIMTNRRVLSLRSVALAAIAILIFDPVAAVSASFHLSFAATAALVRFFEYWNRRPSREKENHVLSHGFWSVILKFSVISLMATGISQAAIAPFALYHFGTVSFFGSLANVIAMPLMTFVLMPLILVGLILSVFDQFYLIAPLLGFGLQELLELAAWFADFPYAVIQMPLMPASALLVMTTGFGLWLMLKGKKAFFLLASSIGLGFIIHHGHISPDILISGERPSVAFKVSDYSLVTYGLKEKGFLVENWAQITGTEFQFNKKNLKDETQPTVRGDQIIRRCDNAGCVFYWDRPKQSLVILFAVSDSIWGLGDDCAKSHLVITRYSIGGYPLQAALCQKTRVISIDDLLSSGPLSVYLDHDYSAKIIQSGETGSALKFDHIDLGLPAEKRRYWHKTDNFF